MGRFSHEYGAPRNYMILEHFKRNKNDINGFISNKEYKILDIEYGISLFIYLYSGVITIL